MREHAPAACWRSPRISELVDRHLQDGRGLGDVDLPARRTVVVCPHPDDEALATGGLIARQSGRGVAVLVVAVTDGEAAFSSAADAALAARRRAEQSEALRRLGHDPTQTVRLGLPDGLVARRERDLADALGSLLVSGDLVVAPSTGDWHPDHEACGRAAGLAAAALGCEMLGSLFWAHHHPGHVAAGASLVGLTLTEDERQRRLAAVRAHASQLSSDTPVVRPEQLRHLDQLVEYYIASPESAVWR